MSELKHTTDLTMLECCCCAMPFALSRQWVKYARQIGHFQQQFRCPYCEKLQGWGTSEQEREAEHLRKDAAWERERRIAAERDAKHFRRSRDGTKGALSKLKKRAVRGVCPYCNRSFANLREHMEGQHPDIALGEVDEGGPR